MGASLAAGLIAVNAKRPIVFLYAAIFCTAILKTPELPIVREKFAATELFMLLTWLFWSQLKRRRGMRPSDAIVQPLGIFFIFACMISGLIGLASFPRLGGRFTSLHAGVLVEVINYAYGVIIVFTVVAALDRWGRLTGAVFAWLLGMAVASFVGTLALANLAPEFAYEEGTRRISSTLRNENQVPSMILPLITVPIMIVAHRSLGVFARASMLALTSLAFLAALGTGSRTAILMLILAALLLGVSLFQDSQARQLFNTVQLRSLAVVFSLAIIAYFVIAWSAYDGRYSLVRTPSWQRPAALLIEAYQGRRNLDNTRPEQIGTAMIQFWKTPVFGTGPKLGSRVAGTHGEVHNTYFSLLLETGMVGLLLHLTLLIRATSFCYRAVHRCPGHWYRMLGRGLLIGIALLVLYNCTILGLRQRNIWFMIGFLFAYGNLVRLGITPPTDLRLPVYLRPWRAFFTDHTAVR